MDFFFGKLDACHKNGEKIDVLYS